MEMMKVKIDDFGGAPIAEHNMPCAVCHKKKAVYNLSAGHAKSGVFDPCWDCEKKGWFTSRVTTSFAKFMRKRYFP